MADRTMPTARVGYHSASVDTAGMDPDMKETLGVSVDKKPADTNPVVAAWKKMFGSGKPAKTAAQKSASVKRTSDIPQLSPAASEMEGEFSAERKSSRVGRTSDLPVVKKGQGIQGGAHKNTGTAGGY